MKKLIVIVAIILIVAGVAGYFQFRSSNNSNQGVAQKILDLFPGGSTRNIPSDNSFSSNSGEGGTIATSSLDQPLNLTAKFIQITPNPISGATMVSASASSTVWYMEKETGYLFSYDQETGQKIQLTNTTKPGVEEIYWGLANKDIKFILRYMRDSAIENYLGKIDSSNNSLGSISGFSISPEISTLAVSPDHSKFFYLSPAKGGATGFIRDFSGAKETSITSSSYSKWQVSWPETNTILLTSAPISNQNGYVYSYNLKTKSSQKLLDGLGLTALMSPGGNKILFSTNNNGLALRLKNTDDRGNGEILTIKTLPEKCVWTKNSSTLYCSVPSGTLPIDLPDSWYQGKVGFSDSFFKVDTKTGSAKQIFSPSLSGKIQIDGVNMFLNNKEDKLFLTNRQDGSFWVLNLKDDFASGQQDNKSASSSDN